MPLKTVEIEGKQYAEVRDGKPVYLDAEGKEHVYDAEAMRGTLNNLNPQLEDARKANAELQGKLKQFEGIQNPQAALDAIKKLETIDAKKLIDAGEVEKVKSEISKVYEDKLAESDKRATALEQELYGEKIGGAFARSKFAAEKLAIPSDFVQARFGNQFKLEDGKVVAYDSSGNRIYSHSNPGELAGFDEALEILVNQYPQRDHILKGSGHNGSGKQPGANGDGKNGAKVITRSEFDKLDPPSQMAKMKDGFEVVDALQ